MTGITSLLKILCVPLLVTLLSQLMYLIMHGLSPNETTGTTVLTNGDVARIAFINQMSIVLVLTILIGMPLFRYWARRGKLGFAQWLLTWTLVHVPFVFLNAAKTMELTERVLGIVALGGNLLVVASVWWMLFYAEKLPPESRVFS